LEPLTAIALAALGALLAGAGLTAAAYRLWRQNRYIDHQPGTAWRRHCRDLPHLFEESARPGHRCCLGQRAGAGFEVEIFTPAPLEGKTPQVLLRAGRIPEHLQLERQRGDGPLQRALQGEDEQVGDPDFDRRVVIRGLKHTDRASLDAQTRARLVDFLEAGGTLEQGRLVWRRRSLPSLEQLEDQLERSCALAGALRLGGQATAEKLSRGPDEEPVPGVRAGNLEALWRWRPGRPEVLRALRAALEDPAPEVAMTAALRLGEEGLPAARALLREPSLPEPLRLRALEALGPAIAGSGAVSLATPEPGVGAVSLGADERAGALSEAAGEPHTDP
jgi:hypothetical protein